jgi:Holliday junction DNA helicase RuvB
MATVTQSTIEQRSAEQPLRNDNKAVRPPDLKRFIGQSEAVKSLLVSVESSKVRRTAHPHVLFSGPPGLGKTTLALALANELGVGSVTTSGPVLKNDEDVLGIFRRLKAGDVLFIDEIHAMERRTMERLYMAMEDCLLDVVVGEGIFASARRIRLKPFTLVGATTHPGSLPKPLRDRFAMDLRLVPYSDDELRRTLLDRHPNMESVADMLVSRSRGTPRVMWRLVYAAIRASTARTGEYYSPVTEDDVLLAMEAEGIDDDGLNLSDRKYLKILLEFYDGGPAGLHALSVALNETTCNVSEVIEPYLIQEGYIARTPRGRVLLPRGVRKAKSFGNVVVSQKQCS